jgi:serine/threonine protein kinase
MEGSLIGKYKILRLIGEGGMASVYEAEHEMLGTKVAVKVLNPILSANAQIKERFRNEAKLMASLDHPNITKVIDFDEQPQQLSIIMEFLNGEDLNDKIKRNGALSEKETLDIFAQTLSAFQYAHEKGIVHRDIKPSNIFILPDGRVKILDFGIAKLFGQGNEMTQTGTQMGTPIYMSPEQVKADKSIDHRSDLYSLGVTLYFAINGKSPYNSETDSQFDIFNKIVYEPLPLFSTKSKFNEIVLRACKKDREERFQSCREWLIQMSQEIDGENNNSSISTSYDSNYEKTIAVDNTANKFLDSENINLIQNSNGSSKDVSMVKTPKEKSKYIGIIGAVFLIIIGLFYFLDSTKKNDTMAITISAPTDPNCDPLDPSCGGEGNTAFTIEDSVDVASLSSLRQRILEGEDFEKIAREYSTDPSVKQTGGYYSAKRGQMVAPLEEMFYKTDSGTISPIFKTEFGYSIIKALGQNEEGEYFFQWILISHPKKDGQVNGK